MYSETKFKTSTFLEIILLIILICGFSLFIGVKISRGNPIDRIFRPKLLQSEITKSIFFLDDLGDYRYNITRSNSIAIEIYQQESYKLKASDNEISKMLSRNLRGKLVKVTTRVLDDQSRSIKDIYRTYLFNKISGQAKIAIFGRSKSAETPTIVGETYESQGIIIYEGRVEELSRFLSYQKKIELSTILHEFGHLLGLEHTNNPKCVMAEMVEVGLSREEISDLELDYCSETLAKMPW